MCSWSIELKVGRGGPTQGRSSSGKCCLAALRSTCLRRAPGPDLRQSSFPGILRSRARSAHHRHMSGEHAAMCRSRITGVAAPSIHAIGHKPAIARYHPMPHPALLRWKAFFPSDRRPALPQRRRHSLNWHAFPFGEMWVIGIWLLASEPFPNFGVPLRDAPLLPSVSMVLRHIPRPLSIVGDTNDLHHGLQPIPAQRGEGSHHARHECPR